jgi:hypothetical protein
MIIYFTRKRGIRGLTEQTLFGNIFQLSKLNKEATAG